MRNFTIDTHKSSTYCTLCGEPHVLWVFPSLDFCSGCGRHLVSAWPGCPKGHGSRELMDAHYVYLDQEEPHSENLNRVGCWDHCPFCAPQWFLDLGVEDTDVGTLCNLVEMGAKIKKSTPKSKKSRGFFARIAESFSSFPTIVSCDYCGGDMALGMTYPATGPGYKDVYHCGKCWVAKPRFWEYSD